MDYIVDFDSKLVGLIDSVKIMLYSRHPNIFERIAFDDDRPYFDPLLYNYLKQKDDKWLDSILYSYEIVKKENILVFSNAEGIIYISGTGYFRTSLSNQVIVLETKKGEITLKQNGESLEFEFEPLLIADYGIEILKYHHPLLSTVFVEQGINETDVFIEDIYKSHFNSFNAGLRIIEESNPEFFEMLLKTLKKAMLFSSVRQNSFAVLAAHHMIFLNVNPWDREIFFTDHISHEGSHVIYNTLTFTSKSELFTCDYLTPLGELAGNPNDKGSLYSRFHGLFTYIGITQVLQRCIEAKNLDDEQYLEAIGRFIFHMQSFSVVFQAFDSISIFREEGLAWYEIFKTHFKKMEPAFNRLNPLFDLGAQPYDFNSRIFFESIKLPVRL